MEQAPQLHAPTHERTRQHPRVPGPFEGWWITALPVAVHIHDLSVGGCLIQSYHPQPPGRRLTLEIDLPFHGRVTVEAETVVTREGYGFAVRFVDMLPDVRGKLNDVVRRLMVQAPSSSQTPAMW